MLFRVLIFSFLLFSGGLFAVDFNNATHTEVKKSGKVWGIDISHHQEIQSWQTIREQKPAFVFMKATEGVTHKDRKYEINYKEARDLGLTIGSYHFFSYKSSGRKQAEHFLDVVNFKKGDLPLVLDAEFHKNMPPDRLVTMELLAFLEHVTYKTKVKPIIYCNYRYYVKYLQRHIEDTYPLWIVDYQKEPKMNYVFWQSTEKFKLPGIKGFVDFNVFSGSHDDLSQLLK